MYKITIFVDKLILVLVSIVLALFVLFFVGSLTGCKEEAGRDYSQHCRELWMHYAGTEFDMRTEKETIKPMPNSYIYRCCELIDGGDSPSEQSGAEGTCMAELLVGVVTYGKEVE